MAIQRPDIERYPVFDIHAGSGAHPYHAVWNYDMGSKTVEVLDELTVSRIKGCKDRGFPVCLEKSVIQIFKDPVGQKILHKLVLKLNLSQHNLTCAGQIWAIYERVLNEVANELGKDVAEIVKFQSVKEMEAMKGCMMCPLYQRNSFDGISP